MPPGRAVYRLSAPLAKACPSSVGRHRSVASSATSTTRSENAASAMRAAMRPAMPRVSVRGLRGGPSDPAVGEELGVVALAGLGPRDLLGRVELGEVDDLHVVAGPLEGVL